MLNGELAGRYAVERELGRGGMATVYLADDLKHHRKVAIKFLRPEVGKLLGPDRFSREIQVAASLNHPHILPLYDSGEVDGLLFYVMPYVRGESLRQRLDREKQLPIDEVLRIAQAGRRRPGPRPRERSDPPRHQAGEHPAARGRGDGRRLRDRAGRERGLTRARGSRRWGSRWVRRHT